MEYLTHAIAFIIGAFFMLGLIALCHAAARNSDD